MDPVLNALKQYRLTASLEKKAEDLARLEDECISNIEAKQYVRAVTIQSQKHTVQINELVNYNLNPDYNLDFSLSITCYVDTCCICV